MGPTLRTRVRLSGNNWLETLRNQKFSATRKDASGALRKIMFQSPATRRSVICGAMENITWRCVNQLELTDINLLQQIQPMKIQAMRAGTILRKTIRPSQKDLHLLVRRLLLQSALVDIAAGSRSCLARLLFDSGLQRTFFSQDSANRIGAQSSYWWARSYLCTSAGWWSQFLLSPRALFGKSSEDERTSGERHHHIQWLLWVVSNWRDNQGRWVHGYE